jgi:heme-degrading monooxygenase HmoA
MSGGVRRGHHLDAQEVAMFARSTTIQAQPSMIEAGIAHVRDNTMPAMSHIDGFLGLSLVVDRTSGRCIATSAWRSEDAMRASANRVATIRDEASRVFGGAGSVEEWEVAVMHRAHHARPGTCMRVTWSRLDGDNMADALDHFKFGTIAKIEDLPGFCSASLLVNRAEGRACISVAFDDRAALEHSREAGAAVRDEAAKQADADITDVAEFDLVLAHLHVPEMV